MIVDEKSFESKLCTTANEHAPNGFEEKNKDDDRKETKHDNWTQPNKCVPIMYFF